MENENRLTYVDEDGNEVLCEILFTFDSEDFNKSYVLFYPVGSEDEEEGISVMAASYIPTEDGIGELNEIETDEEWEMIEEVLQSFDDEECDCDECEDEECDDDCCCHHHKEEK